MGFDLETCARSNILKLQPYRCARDDYEDNGTNILLDANENAYGPGLDATTHGAHVNGNDASSSDLNLSGLNRYPDPHQNELKSLICALRNPLSNPVLTPANLFVGVGSDEAIDNLQRTFCVPGQSSMLVCPPTYGMYSVSAHVNDVAIRNVPLTLDFLPDVPAIKAALTVDKSIRLVYLCSPGNPTGRLIPEQAVKDILAFEDWNGVLVIDEAYVDFASPTPVSSSNTSSEPPRESTSPWRPPSLAPLVPSYSNLVVMGTLSKGHGLAGLRLGFVICAPPIARLLNALKAPYNISSPTSQLAIQALQPASLALAAEHIRQILVQRDRLVRELPLVPGMGKIIGGLDANFLLVQVLNGVPASSSSNGGGREEAASRESEGDGLHRLTLRKGPASNPHNKPNSNNSPPLPKPSNRIALAVYERLAASRGVVTRFRGKELGCEGCLRVTVGTEREVDVFLAELRNVLGEVLGIDGRGSGGDGVCGEGRSAGEEERREIEESGVVA